MREFRTAVELRPDYPEAQNNLGLLEEEAGDITGAHKAFEEAVHRQPQYAEARNNLGQLLEGLGETDRAIEQFRAALDARPDFAQAHENLGMALWKKRDLAGAATELRQAGSLGLAEALISLGVVLGEKGELDAAIAAHRKAVKLLPRDAQTHYLLGGGLRQKGDLDAAAPELRKALDLDPQLAPARLHLGVVLRQQGKLEESAHELRAATQLDPKNAEAHYQLGFTFRLLSLMSTYCWRSFIGFSLPPFRGNWCGIHSAGAALHLVSHLAFPMPRSHAALTGTRKALGPPFRFPLLYLCQLFRFATISGKWVGAGNFTHARSKMAHL